jgi:hypothetical protein
VSTVSKTRHIQQRMNQRGIRSEVLGVVEQFGSWQGDKCILNRKACDDVLCELDRIRRTVIKAQHKGGIVLVESNDVQITTYSLDSYERIH